MYTSQKNYYVPGIVCVCVWFIVLVTDTCRDAEQSQVGNGKIENDIKIYASLLPDEIIYNGGSNSTQTYYGAVLFADVSGFTDLCEKYNEMGKGGLSRLTEVLNSFIGAMVEEILMREGDVLKFSGDAFLALWKRRKNVPMSEVVHAALDTALSIQNTHGTFPTDVGVTLRVKIAIAAGYIVFTVLGNSNFMVIGHTIWEMKDVGNACQPGDIITTPNIIFYVDNKDYIFDKVTSDGYIKVLGSKRSIDQFHFLTDIYDTSLVMREPENRASEAVSEENLLEFNLLGDEQNGLIPFTLRPSLDYAVQHHMKAYLAHFIIAPVVNVVDQHQPLDFLTEMRQVVIVFVNVILDLASELEHLVLTIDHVYGIVCRVVTDQQGCVNKVSMFDKDLMCLVIFGLRGINYKLKIQRALQCASIIWRELRLVAGVQSVSVGVTFGITYCGVVGHPQRREYTVIGRTVNKAARLMVAYPNKVTCDTYVFLYSRLQTHLFTRQESVPLKGFQDVGPIYEYNDDCLHEASQLQLGKYPPVGRDRETKAFFRLLDAASEDTADCKMLVFSGSGRQGKSTLLSELAHRVQLDKRMAVYTCHLTMADQQEPYQAIRSLYYDRIRISGWHDTAARTRKFSRIFALHSVPAFLCALNDIFHVDFAPSRQFGQLNADQRRTVRHHLLQDLCRMVNAVAAFTASSVLFVDNLHHMDRESWTLLDIFLDCRTLFVCASLTTYSILPPESVRLMSDERVRTLPLEEIHKKHHGTIICQLLEAHGLVLDLERRIQVQSEGNPGFIENLLMVLLHSNTLTVMTTDAQTAYTAGLVSPSNAMLTRDTSGESRIVLETPSYAALDFETDKEEIWKMYAVCIKADGEADRLPKAGGQLRVCITNTEERFDAVNTYTAPDVQLMADYDALDIQEQQFLKCCAVLGDAFRRSKLVFVWKSQDERALNLLVQRLFEVRLLACNSGAYRTEAILEEYEPVHCVCPDVSLPEDCKDLARYAACGFIRFKRDDFRKIVHDMLTETQLRAYHVRSIWYLENETRRCEPCGGGYFTRLLGQIYDDGMLCESMDQIPSLTDLNMPFGLSLESIMHGDLGQSNDGETRSRNSDASDLYDQRDHIRELYRLQTLSSERPVPRTFAQDSLVSCTCVHILDNMYWQMVCHCQETKLHEKLLYTALEYTSINLRQLNVPMCLRLLATAEAILEGKLVDVYPEWSWQVPLLRGRIHTLAGQVQMACGDWAQAERRLQAALRCYNLRFPARNRLACSLHTHCKELQQRLCVRYYRYRQADRPSSIEERTLTEQTSDTLATLFRLYRRLGQRAQAYLAAVWSLSMALRSGSNFFVLCNAYAAVFTADTYRHRSAELMARLEDMAFSMCYHKLIRLEVHELEAVGKMYSAVFSRRCLCENMASSLHIGFVLLQMNMAHIRDHYRWLNTTLLLKAYTFTRQVSQALVLLQQLHCLLNIYDARMLYLALCLDLRLDTTVLALPWTSFPLYEVIVTKRYTRTIPCYDIRYHVALWLWTVRTENWERAWCQTCPMLHMLTWSAVVHEPPMVFTYLQLVEGLLLLIRRNLDLCKHRPVAKYRALVRKHFKRLDTVTGRLKGARPRFLHLKAYYKMLFRQHKSARCLLTKAQMLAVETSNQYEYEWIAHNTTAWKQHHHQQQQQQNLWLTAVAMDMEYDGAAGDAALLSFPYFTYPLMTP